MRRSGFLVAGAIAVALAIVLAPARAYLAGWLFLIGIVTGALPVAIVLDWRALDAPLLATSRTLARAIPVAALLLIPVLVRLHTAYGWDGSTRPPAPFGREWLTPGFFIARSVVYLVIWSLLGFVVTNGRSVPAALGLGVHLLVGSLAALDWVLSVDPEWHSSVIGLLVISGQAASAASLAVLIAGPTRAARTALLVTAGAWFFLQFIQFLVTWSGNLPDGAAWYAARDAAGGRALEWFWAVAAFPLPALLLTLGRAAATRAAALLILLAQAVSTLWLVAPGEYGSGALTVLAFGIAAAAVQPILGRSYHRQGAMHERVA